MGLKVTGKCAAWAVFFTMISGMKIAVALNPERQVSQYGHTAWRIQDGMFEGTPHAIAQTTDGYLWIGTETGLVRFDGGRFVPWTAPPGKSLPSMTIQSLVGARDGGLWIGTAAGLAYWKDQKLTNYPDTAGRINAIVESREGTVWIARSRIQNATGPLCQVRGMSVRCYGERDGIAFPWAETLSDDGAGGVWVGTTRGVCHWTPHSIKHYYSSNLRRAAGTSGVEALARLDEDSMLVGIGQAGNGQGIRLLTKGKWSDYSVPPLKGSSVAVAALMIDRDRNIWIASADTGIYHIHRNRPDRFGQADGLSSDSVSSFFEDREGNVWTTSPRGIDRFRDLAVTSFSKREGLGVDVVSSVFASKDGTVWLGNGGALTSLPPGGVGAIHSQLGLPGNNVTSLLEDHAGRLWIGVDAELTVQKGQALEKVRAGNRLPLGMVTGLTEDAQQNIWALVIGKPQKLVRIRDGKVTAQIAIPYPAFGGTLASDPKDGIWLGFTNGSLARYRGEKFEIISAEDDPGSIKHVFADPDGSVWAAAENGMVHWKEGKRRTLRRGNGLPCDSIFSAIRDNAGTLWLYSACGVMAISQLELERWWTGKSGSVAVKVFDSFDGAQPGATPFSPPVSKSSDGRLWFTNDTALQAIDPAHLAGNNVPPPVRIEGVVADQKAYAPTPYLRLPASTKNLQIDYTALSLTMPQKVRFHYKLESRDRNWQEPGARRQAFYNDLAPGKYRFVVTACNNNGVWNETGASWSFSIEPAYYQTIWFRVVSIMLAGLAIFTGYRIRVARIDVQLNARFDERAAERNRLSSELHDTFLQSVEASKMVADYALVESPQNPDHMRKAMVTLSGWLTQATSDGRAALNTLRSSVTLQNNLAEAFQRAAEIARAASSMEFVLSVEGEIRAIHPIVRDEVVRIGSEAIRNASRRPKRDRLRVIIRYARDLTIRVSDTFAAEIGLDARFEKTARLEVAVLQERALRIGSKVKLIRESTSETEIELRVPGRIAFRDAGEWMLASKLRQWWKANTEKGEQ